MEIRRATAEDLAAIVHLDARVLPGHDVIPVGVFAGWAAADPDAFQVVEVGGRVVGYLAVLALAPGALACFEAGEIDERALGPGDVLGPEAAREARTVYFFSVARDPAHPEIGRALVAAAEACWRGGARFPRVERVLATAATVAGRRMLLRLGFELRMEADRRLDGHALFELRLPRSADVVH